ncbi:GNAT family N-acetyltransferase [Gynuella sunshinyii]|uniref:N-acetylglutamate synthase and related acetyltransferase n=1 Tax=Gynuella sunshinyii YC6258 TaxID=1445510 RepID=A0A0C5VGJ3_9GAMM|nr:GNAT family N-acetyltransferase [Gynuella sunshinyii]AJQ93712.1 N-acetylglutamate synthase and related acetyltransferase [Gynuella sunshinyii YC6258]
MITDYQFSSDPKDMDVSAIHQFLSRSYWSEGLPMSVLQKAMKNSMCFGIFTSDRQQVGFARMITDKATFAYLADVYILEAHRGKGLSKWLVKNILEHPDLQGLRRILLATRDAHELYARFGFEAVQDAKPFMQINHPNIYR